MRLFYAIIFVSWTFFLASSSYVAGSGCIMECITISDETCPPDDIDCANWVPSVCGTCGDACFTGSSGCVGANDDPDCEQRHEGPAYKQYCCYDSMCYDFISASACEQDCSIQCDPLEAPGGCSWGCCGPSGESKYLNEYGQKVTCF